LMIGRSHDDGHIEVLDVLPRGPASRAGICRGDVLWAVDGQSLAGLHIPQVHELIKGPAGSAMQLTVTAVAGAAPAEESQPFDIMGILSPRRSPSAAASSPRTITVTRETLRAPARKRCRSAERAGAGGKARARDCQGNARARGCRQTQASGRAPRGLSAGGGTARGGPPGWARGGPPAAPAGGGGTRGPSRRAGCGGAEPARQAALATRKAHRWRGRQ